MTAPTIAAMSTPSLVKRPSATVAPASAHRTAIVTETWVPRCATTWARAPSILLIQPGSLSFIPVSIVPRAPGELLAGWRAKYARLPHSRAHSSRGVTGPSRPVVATDDPRVSAAGDGHASNAKSTYRITAPGAPVNGLAVPVSTPPSPSPSHHTATAQAIEAASAALTVRRHSRPRARNSWMVAKSALQTAMCCIIRFADQVIGVAMTAGLPSAVPWMTSLTKPLENMYGWYCRAASSSQITPRVSWRARRRVARTGVNPERPGRRVRPRGARRNSMGMKDMIFVSLVVGGYDRAARRGILRAEQSGGGRFSTRALPTIAYAER